MTEKNCRSLHFAHSGTRIWDISLERNGDIRTDRQAKQHQGLDAKMEQSLKNFVYKIKSGS